MTDATPMMKDDLLKSAEQGYKDFDAYLRTLTEAQLTVPMDPAGWTAKDHVMHLAVWQEGIIAVLEGRSRREGMGIDQALWDQWDVDAINDVIQKRYHDLPLAEVLNRFRQAYEQLVAKVRALSEADLRRSFRSYQPDTKYDGPLSSRILANTSGHFEDHTPWIAAIVAS